MSEEWGPWIEHDGRGCPCVGLWVESVERRGLVEQHIAGGCGDGMARQWDWSIHPVPAMHIIRYRIRKPRGLTILEGLLTDLPEKVDA